MNKDDPIARVFDVQFSHLVDRAVLARWAPMHFRVYPGPTDSHLEMPVPCLVYRAATWYLTFAIALKDVPIYVNDIIRTNHQTSMALEFLIGARFGITKGATVKLLSDGRVALLSDGEWNTIALNSGGVFAKFHKAEKPLKIQTRGGVIGIKG